MSGSIWMLATVLGPIILGVALVYALMRRRRLTPTEKTAQHEAIEELYEADTPNVGAQDGHPLPPEMEPLPEPRRHAVSEERPAAALAVSDHLREHR